jgi:hypothetical protein
MQDPRQQKWVRYHLSELLRERIYSLALNYRTSDDVDLLAHDAVMRMAVWNRPGDKVLEERLASQPTQSRLLDILATSKGNLEAVRGALSEWIERHLRSAGKDRGVMRGTIDVDGMPIETHGLQPGTAYNGYYKETVYYPLVAGFAAEGDYDSARLGSGFVHAILRGGNAAGAEGALRFIRNAYRKCSRWAKCLDVRMDAAFTIGSIMDKLKEDGIRFVGRLRSNEVLERLALPHVDRPQGRPPKEGYEYTVELGEHRAESWRHGYRLVLVVVDKPDPKTGLSVAGLLAPHLSEANASQFIRDCERRTRREAERYLAAFKARPAFEPSMRKRPASPESSQPTHEASLETSKDGASGEDSPSSEPIDSLAPASELPPAPKAPASSPSVLQPAAPDLFNVRFSASGGFRAKLLRLAEVLGIERPERRLGEVLERALDLALEQKAPERKAARRAKREAARAANGPRSNEAEGAGESARDRAEGVGHESPPTPERAETRSRHLSAALRHRVLARAGYQCEYRGPGGRRCPQRTGLEIDHRRPFARGGGHEEENLRALCKAHNLFRAEKDFGQAVIRTKAAARRCGGGSAKGVIGRGAGTCALDDPALA